MVRTPSFRYMGGKVRLRSWLISHFPQHGNKYIELFSGPGNVFFQAKKSLNFNSWHLNDINIKLLKSLLSANLEELPLNVKTKEEFNYYKNAHNDISNIIEPRITFAGKGYKSGFDKGDTKHPRYTRRLYKDTCNEAVRLLEGVHLSNLDWESYNLDLTFDDFVYLDPPYYNTKICYPNIDHLKLIEVLNGSNFKWAMSGYDCDIYNNLNYQKKFQKTRNSEIKGCNSRKYEHVVETLWINY